MTVNPALVAQYGFNVVERTADSEVVIANCGSVEDAERIIAALRYFRNGGGQSGDHQAPHIDTAWEVAK